jgi:hypothetical protein
MKRFLITLLIAIVGIALCPAQDSQLQQLVEIVSGLRTSTGTKDEAAFKGAADKFRNITWWTPMDELIDNNGNECAVFDRSLSRFRLNTLLFDIEQSRKGLSTTRGAGTDGRSKAYDYSLYEKSVKPGKTVSYTLTGREGRQTFIVLPYNPAAKLDVTLLRGTEKLGEGKTDPTSGQIVLQSTATLKADDQLTLEIRNRESKGVAMVILNHNTRKP